MKIWCISDTHCEHAYLDIPEDIDIVIHSGDAGGYRELSRNEAEMREFLHWFSSLPYKYKIYIPGNHDTSMEQGMFNKEEWSDIIILEHESVVIEGIKIFGSPYTPSFGVGWAYNIPRNRIDLKWEDIPQDTDILITHGPPKGILDYTAINDISYTQCGCKSLLNKIKEVKPKYHIFGHLHDETDVLNCGEFKPNGINTTFVNAAVMNLRYEVVNNGIIIEI